MKMNNDSPKESDYEVDNVIIINNHDEVYDVARSIARSTEYVEGDKVEVINLSTSESLLVTKVSNNNYIITTIKEGVYE